MGGGTSSKIKKKAFPKGRAPTPTAPSPKSASGQDFRLCLDCLYASKPGSHYAVSRSRKQELMQSSLRHKILVLVLELVAY